MSVVIGTYDKSGGSGLVDLDRNAGGWTPGASFPLAANASFGAYSQRHDLYYFVDEREDGAIVTLRRRGRSWELIDRLGSGGSEPCYVAIDAKAGWLAVANYASGSVALLELDEKGAPGRPPRILPNTGSGPNRERQEGPHAHCCCFDPEQNWLYHVDLGTDEVWAYPFDQTSGVLGDRRLAFRAKPGAGPRHMAFHPTRRQALLLCELASTLTVLDIDSGGLHRRAEYSTLPEQFGGESLGGHLSLSAAGDRVYVTNRGHDSVAIFDWGAEGALTCLQHIASGGRSPRSFALLEEERSLIVTHEKSGDVSIFSILPDGLLAPTDAKIRIPGAAFVMVTAGA